MSVHVNDPDLQPRAPRRRIACAAADLKGEPAEQATTISQGLYGEAVHELSQSGDWVQVTLRRDGYSGYLRDWQLMSLDTAATHRVDERSTVLFGAPDIKTADVTLLPYSSELVIRSFREDGFAATDTGHFVWAAHCIPISKPRTWSLSEFGLNTLTGIPYLWGGRTPAGLDCSALVQLCAFAAGHELPRDTNLQFEAIAHEVAERDRHRDDLVFWPGHVGVLLDPDHVFHATAHSLKTVVEPLSDIVDRAGEVAGFRRLPVHLQAIRS